MPGRGGAGRHAGAAVAHLAVLEEAVEDGAVGAEVEALELRDVLAHVVLRDVLQESRVLVRVERRDVRAGSLLRPEDVHVLVQAVVDDKLMRQPDAVRAHRVALAVVEVADHRVVEVVDLTTRRRRHRAPRAPPVGLPGAWWCETSRAGAATFAHGRCRPDLRARETAGAAAPP